MSLRPLLLTLLAAAVFALGVFIGHANGVPVQFDYLFGTVEASLIAIVVIAFGFGVLLTLMIVALRLLGLRREVMRLRRHLRDAEAELRNFRNLPVASSTASPAANAASSNASARKAAGS
jgi:uncharacterized membrane protein YciS (DUF1049 family)